MSQKRGDSVDLVSGSASGVLIYKRSAKEKIAHFLLSLSLDMTCCCLPGNHLKVQTHGFVALVHSNLQGFLSYVKKRNPSLSLIA